MLAIEFILISSACVAASNYWMRRSIDAGGTTGAYLMIQFSCMFLVALLLNPIASGDYAFSPSIALLGIAGGAILFGMMAALGRALKRGPAGLTFASLSAATVVPAILMYALFGEPFGFVYSIWNAAGSLLVIAGLFWAGWETVRLGNKVVWLLCAAAAFGLHVLFLAFMQWRALFLNFSEHAGLFLSFPEHEIRSTWFMPCIFLAAALLQAAEFTWKEKRLPLKAEWFFGFLGGLFNGAGTYFLIRATEVATGPQNAIIFPLYSIAIIFLCNLWGQLLYKEKVHWKAMGLCGLGIAIANWV
jgi:drug/metabolite transporter (DMT)-like permease